MILPGDTRRARNELLDTGDAVLAPNSKALRHNIFHLMYQQRIDMKDILRKSDVESRRQDQTQLYSASDSSLECIPLYFFSHLAEELIWRDITKLLLHHQTFLCPTDHLLLKYQIIQAQVFLLKVFQCTRMCRQVTVMKRVKEDQKERSLLQVLLKMISFPREDQRGPSVSADDDSSQDSLADGSQFSQRSSQSQNSEGKPGEGISAGADGNTYEKITGEAETLDILTFVKEHMENGGIIDLMNQYGICLAAQNKKTW
ncbi:uncharacterized protein LOC110069223 [Orbicella faveolata]|uniref:uncharacterized protein LOC110069223 n=1 Tax=Orbicella faveolata TaxID=48498 RepID=UPI0009E4345E|nr:uncharacterized protein LOC110069223 [Orbicella faveolata]